MTIPYFRTLTYEEGMIRFPTLTAIVSYTFLPARLIVKTEVPAFSPDTVIFF